MCKTEKSLDDFHRNKNAAQGRSYRCKVCAKATTLAWTRAHPREHVMHGLEWEKRNPDKAREKRARHRRKHPEQHRAAVAKYHRENPEVHDRNRRLYRERHPDRNAAKTARRRATKRSATPAWVNEFFIQEAYALAKLRTELTGIKWHVDHITPLKSDLVCGLHVEFNLQVIPAVENVAKSNRHWPDMPGPRKSSTLHTYQ